MTILPTGCRPVGASTSGERRLRPVPGPDNIGVSGPEDPDPSDYFDYKDPRGVCTDNPYDEDPYGQPQEPGEICIPSQ